MENEKKKEGKNAKQEKMKMRIDENEKRSKKEKKEKVKMRKDR